MLRQLIILMIAQMVSSPLLSQKPIVFQPAHVLASEIRSGNLTSYQVVSALIEQIEKQNPVVNAMVLLNKEQALARALAADSALARGENWGRLHGVPITLKDNYHTRGMTTTAGYGPLKNHVPTDDAAIVHLLLAEGAIILGKTNLSVLAMDMQSHNPVFGRTLNPWDTTRTCGGSSGGCATALATGMSPLSFGNDLAGSIRLPAAFCGVYGLKPSFGVVSLAGIQTDPKEKTNGLRSLAVAGPLARNMEDLSLAFSIIAQPSPVDPRVIPLPGPQAPAELKALRIAWTDELGGVPVDTAIKQAIGAFVARLEAEGVTVVKAIPELDFYQAWQTWGTLVGMQAGYGTPNWVKWLGLPFTKGVLKQVPMHQNIVKPTSVEKLMAALEQQDQMIAQMESFLGEFDAFICPVSATLPFQHHAPTKHYGNFNIYNAPLRVNGGDIHYYMATQAYTIPFSLTESPVLSMPIGFSDDHLPIGIQVIGKRYGDWRLLEIGSLMDSIGTELNYPLQR